MCGAAKHFEDGVSAKDNGAALRVSFPHFGVLAHGKQRFCFYELSASFAKKISECVEVVFLASASAAFFFAGELCEGGHVGVKSSLGENCSLVWSDAGRRIITDESFTDDVNGKLAISSSELSDSCFGKRKMDFEGDVEREEGLTEAALRVQRELFRRHPKSYRSLQPFLGSFALAL